MKIFKVVFLFLLIEMQSSKAQHFIESDIWLADIRIKEGNIYFGAAKNITNAIGYDSQPFFLNDSTLLYTHIGEDLQADIFQYQLKKKNNSKFTNTKESEYSAKLLPNNKGISVVEVEPDSTQRIWHFDLTGNNGKVYVPNVDSVGYYAWLNDTSFAAFILTEPPSLQICNSSNDKTKTIATNIGRCLQVSSFGNLYFTRLEKDSVRWLCRTEINGSITKLIEFYKGVEDFVISNNNTIFCCKDGMIYYTDNQFNLGWRLCGNFGTMGVNNINRLALSPDNKRMALVNISESKK
jgi:hypothetical protein